MPTQIETPTDKRQITVSETTPGSDIVNTTEDGDADDATNILMTFFIFLNLRVIRESCTSSIYFHHLRFPPCLTSKPFTYFIHYGMQKCITTVQSQSQNVTVPISKVDNLNFKIRTPSCKNELAKSTFK